MKLLLLTCLVWILWDSTSSFQDCDNKSQLPYDPPRGDDIISGVETILNLYKKILALEKDCHCEGTSGNRPNNCAEILKAGNKRSGIYYIYPDNDKLPVYCDMDTNGGGWTVFQRRMDGSVPFNRTWNEYRDGFGDLNTEVWLGNKYIAMLTKGPTKFKLRMDLVDFEENAAYAEYTDFKVADESKNFSLSLGSYSGNTGDNSDPYKGMLYHNGAIFSTMDANYIKCVSGFGNGGFWLQNCGYRVYLNGPYSNTAKIPYAIGVVVASWKGLHTSLKATSMKFRPMVFP